MPLHRLRWAARAPSAGPFTVALLIPPDVLKDVSPLPTDEPRGHFGDPENARGTVGRGAARHRLGTRKSLRKNNFGGFLLGSVGPDRPSTGRPQAKTGGQPVDNYPTAWG